MFIFDWIRRNVAEAVRQGFQDSLEHEPLMRSEPGPPALSAAAEISSRAIVSDSEPAKNGKRLTKAAR
jgi:hypothetical protein